MVKSVELIGRVATALGLVCSLAAIALAQESPGDGDQTQGLRLAVEWPASNAWLKVRGELSGTSFDRSFYTLEKSSDLVRWKEIAVFNQAPFSYADPNWKESNPSYYRAWIQPGSSTNDWANQIGFPNDSYWIRSDCESLDQLQWAKFMILLETPARVYFQDNSRYLLHYDFAVHHFPAFKNLDATAFDAISLRQEGQKVVLGSLLAPLSGNEYGIQFVGGDPYPPSQVADWFQLVKSCVVSEPGVPVYYVPSYEQAPAVAGHEAEYAGNGVPVISASRWLEGNTVCYSPGWALGRLVYIESAFIDQAYTAGELLPTDILVTDEIPSELPYVSGIISLHPATANSHVAILADSYGIPFVYLAEPAEQMRIRALNQQEVVFRTGAFLGACDVTILPLTESISPAFRQVMSSAQSPGSLEFIPKESFPTIVSLTETLTPSDVRYFGGKAAHFGILRQVIPDYSPEAIAFSFDLWDAFLDQLLPDGSDLRTTINDRLKDYTYPPDVGALKADLSFVRAQIINHGQFSPRHQQLILTTVQRFGSTRKIRFRSSTNVEDSEYFSGAGLYDSFSGCLGDDLDEDATGPSVCDENDSSERGVLLAIRRVYASFYNDNAFLERLRLGVREEQAGMALLVHYSTPDEEEMANGVATVRASRTGSNWWFTVQMVSQRGAVSVANPDPDVISEQVDYSPRLFGTNIYHRKTSSLVPLGTTVLSWPDDYQTLGSLILQVSEAFTKDMTNRSEVFLDLEYKKISPGFLEIKQVREIPSQDPNQSVPAFMVSQAYELAPFGSILSTHRLKSRWRLGTPNLSPSSPPHTGSFYDVTEAEYREGDVLQSRTNLISHWPQAQFAVGAPTSSPYLWTTNTWGSDTEPGRSWALVTRFDRSVTVNQSPARMLSDIALQLSVKHPAPVPDLSFLGTPGITSILEESVTLYPVRDLTGSTATEVLLTTNGLTWSLSQRMEKLFGSASTAVPRPGCAIIGGKSPFAYVGMGGSMRLVGLIAEPLELHGNYSQTFILRGREGHELVHEAVADPWMEPELPARTKAALTAANIRLVVYHSYQFGDFTEYLFIVGLDGSARRWQ